MILTRNQKPVASNQKNGLKAIIVIFLLASGLRPAFAQGAIGDYLCEIAESYYLNGRYEDALHEFNKALLADPENIKARKYVDKLTGKSKDALKPKEAEKIRIKENALAIPSSEKSLPVVEEPATAFPLKKESPRMKDAALIGPRESAPEEPILAEAGPKRIEPKTSPKPKVTFERKHIVEPIIPEETRPRKLIARNEAEKRKIVSSALNDFIKEERLEKKQVYASSADKLKEAEAIASPEQPDVKISGEIQARAGITPRDFYWKRANWDLNEKNFRTISNTALDRRINTYDSRIYDRLSLNLDAGNQSKGELGFHSNLVVDPWSFTGKSDKVTVYSNFGDSANVELKYWSNTGYAINEVVNSKQLGNSFALPEIKVEDSKVEAFTVKGAFDPNDTFYVPELKIHREFQPVRELWFDYAQDDFLKLRIFPLAYEGQALTLNDPLRLSNNHTWWEDSPWVHGWKHGQLNSGVTPNDFTKGYWDNSLSFFARDSEGRRLTLLRGFSFELNPGEETTFITSFATPKNPWQEYSEYDNLLSVSRLTKSLGENTNLGLSATTRFGYDADNKDKLDARNYMGAADAGYEVIDGIKAQAEVARSQSEYDLTNSKYSSSKGGNAYYFSVLGRFPFQSIREANSYDEIQPGKLETDFTKFRFFVGRLDPSFDASLSSYVETRDDEYWSRHIHFRQPFKYYFQGEGRLLSWDDVKPYRIGNGIDSGASTLGFRIESLLMDQRIENLFDVRNLHYTSGEFLENVSREELTWKVNDRLTGKLFGLYHRLPHTRGGFDPYILDPRTGYPFLNSYIEDGKNPSVATGSLGLEYAFFDWLTLNGIWEYTNDISLGYDNFPRGILNSGNRSLISYDDNNKYRDISNYLYSQQFFPKPPYPYYNIFKTGLKIVPLEKMEVYLDYTRNPYEKAGPVDDNMNHIGLEVGYYPFKKLGVFLKYTYSRWQDLDTLTQGITKVFGHHNAFTELIYRKSDDEDFTFQFGEASRDPYMGGVLDIGWDPYGGALRTIDTRHIFRLYYRRKF